jgi:exonuclease VII large subunit
MSAPHLADAELPSRVARIETIVEQLASELGQHVATTTSAIERLAQTTQTALSNQNEQAQEAARELSESLRKIASETNASIQSLSLRQEQSRRTPWGTLASWAAIMIAIGGIFGGVIRGELSDVKASVVPLQAHVVEEAYSNGKRDEAQRWTERELERLRAVKGP